MRVNTYTTGDQIEPNVALEGASTFVVACRAWARTAPPTASTGQRSNEIVPVELMQVGVE